MKKRTITSFTPFVPELAVDLVAVLPANRLKLPIVHSAKSGVLYLDISGFTKYTEQASSTGHYGIELITGFLNRYFEVIINVIKAHDGQVVKFGGDSCLSLFQGTKSKAVNNLLACRKEILQDIAKPAFKQILPAGMDLKVHGGIAYGEVITYIIGSMESGLNYFMCGPAVKQAYEADKNSLAGEITIADNNLNNIKPAPTQRSIYIAKDSQRKIKLSKAGLFTNSAIRDKLTNLTSVAELRNSAIIFVNICSKDKSEPVPAEMYQEFYNKVHFLVNEYGGVINKVDYSDKGYLIIIAFGVLQTYPDLIERAFLCAWRIIQIQTDLMLRIGITSCNIYAGIIGSRVCCEYGIIGNGVNIAARLMSSADYGEIILSGSIVKRIRPRFQVSFVSEVALKGIKEKISMYRLVNELPESWFSLRQAHGEIPLLARVQTVKRIREQLAAKQKRIILLTGATGLGKSYLVFQIGKQWVKTKKDVFYYAGDQVTARRRLEFFFQLARKYLGIADFSHDLNKLVSWCQSNNMNIDPHLLLKWLIGKQRVASTEPTSHIEYEHGVFFQTLMAISFQILHKMELVVIENIEWLDPDSSALVHGLLQLLSNNHRIIITCCRQDILNDLGKLRPLKTELVPFTCQEASSLTSFLLPNATEETRRIIFAMTGGNPLFIKELCLVLSKLQADQNDLLTAEVMNEMQRRHLLPESLENLFVRAYDELDEQAKSVIMLASILTGSFTAEILQRNLSNSYLTKLDKILDELAEKHLLTVLTIDPRIEYTFVNNIVREAIYGTILLSEKKQLHKSIADNLIATSGNCLEENLEIITEHYIKSEEAEEIVKYGVQTGQKLIALADYEGSIYFLLKALDSATVAESCTCIRLLLLEAYVFQSKAKEAKQQIDQLSYLEKRWQPWSYRFVWLWGRYLNSMAEYSLEMKKIRLWLPNIKDRQYQYLLKLDLMHCYLVLGRKSTFEKQALRFYESLADENELVFRSKLASVLGQFYLEQGNYIKAKEYFKVRLFFSLKGHDYLGQRLALTSLGTINSRLGEKKAAFQLYDKALKIAEKMGDRNGYSKILLDLGALYRNEGEYERAMEYYSKSLKLVEVTQNRLQEATLLYNIGELNYYLMKYDIALDHFTRSEQISKEINDEVGITYCNDASGDILFQTGRYDEAEAIYKNNLKVQTRLGDKEGIGHTLGNLGNIAKVRGKFATAVKMYHRQMELIAEVGDKEDLGRAIFNLATIEIEQGKSKSALEKLNQALQLFLQCSSAYYVEQTEKLIRETEQKHHFAQ